MLESAAAVGAAGLAAKKLVDKTVEDLYEAAKGRAKAVISKWKLAGQRDRIAERLQNVEMVRTIKSTTPVSLSTFYYPSRISEGRDGARVVNCLTDISAQGNILIIGTVGQGKSIFLRYLCLQEIFIGRRIPVFIELRALDEKTSLVQLITHRLALLGMEDLGEEALQFIFESGAFVFFLDGFDEVKRELVLSTQRSLAVLMLTPQTRWIISSRPGALSGHLGSLSDLSIYGLAPLMPADFEPFLSKLGVPLAIRAKLIESITSSPTQIRQLLQTPLMLTLLNMTFGTSTYIPPTLHEFYEEMFGVLVSRHDETKELYIREKATKLSNSDLQDVFEHFCFLSKEHGVSLTTGQFAACATKASRLTNKEFTTEGLKTDLIEIVCLMMRDGLKFSFIHRSIQEFFAASFVKNLGQEEKVIKIYSNLKGSRLAQWSQELNFLKEIDKYRYIEHFVLPNISLFKQALNYKTAVKPFTKAELFKFFLPMGVVVLTPDSDGKDKMAHLFCLASEYEMTGTVFELLKSFHVNFISFAETIAELKNGLIPDMPTRKIVPFVEWLKSDSTVYANYYEQTKDFANKMEKERNRLVGILAKREKNFAAILGI